MLIEKLNNSQVEKETAGYIKLFKNKTTGELMYLTKDNHEVVFPTEDKVLQLITDNMPSSDYTETIVNIPSSASGTITYSDGRPNATGGILGMGTTPIELLPAAGDGKYYDVEKIVIESTYNTSVYTVPSQLAIVLNGDTWSGVDPSIFLLEQNTICILNTYTTAINNVDQWTYPRLGILNQNCYFTTAEGNPTDGDGTLRVKIYHKTITFGA